ncbi:unnamed protein product [Ixodes hexagonus]
MLCCNHSAQAFTDSVGDRVSPDCSLVNMSRIGRPGSYLYEVLSSMIQSNVDYFRYVNTETGNKILAHLTSMQQLLQWIETSAYKITSSAHRYDFDSETPANGFRSFITVVDRFILLATKLCRTICMKRDSMFFRSESCLRELEDHVGILHGLKIGMALLERMMENTDDGSLFVSMEFNDLFNECDRFDPTSFYGRCMGFYYCDPIRRTLKKGHAVLSAYRDHYYQTGRNFGDVTSLLWGFSKYSMDPELRSKQMVEMRKNIHLDFLKAMWSLNEQAIFKKVHRFVSSSLPVCTDVVVPLERLTLPKAHDPSVMVEIPIPSSHAPASPVHCRFLSSSVREGMESLLPSNLFNSSDVLPPSHGLILHFHGGGFIAQSAESHEASNALSALIYLKDWAKLVNVPILSVDYALAPEFPYPRALEEVAFVYAWVLNNCHKLGWTGERICVAGDSAGGNLCLALCLRMVEMELRTPDSVFCAYTPTMLNAHPSPSKVLTCMDPLIPLEFLLTCVHAYLGVGKTHREGEDDTPDHIHENISLLHESRGEAHRQVDQRPEHSGDSTAKEQSHPVHSGDQQCTTSAKPRPKELDSPVQNCGDFVEATDVSVLEQDGAEEHVIFEIPPDLPVCLKQKAAEMTKQSMGKASTSAAKRRAPKTRRDKLPWFHPNNPDRLQVFEALVSQGADPLLTPYLASDELLKQLPPAYFLCLHLDPVLDDMVMFAKKLRSLGCSIRVEVLDSLPHGFLNLFPRGKEAQEGMQCCVNMLRHALNMASPGSK